MRFLLVVALLLLSCALFAGLLDVQRHELILNSQVRA